MPVNPHVYKLRRRRLATLKQIERLETVLAGIEADILAFGAQIEGFRQAKTPLFVRGEMQRAIMDVLREAEAPLLMREITTQMLARKGVADPDKALLEHLWHRVGCSLAVMRKHGRVELSGSWHYWRWSVEK